MYPLYQNQKPYFWENEDGKRLLVWSGEHYNLGNALGIVSGLILGQSAVVADIVSPLLLIVVAASGLGGFCIPNYALSVGIKIIQLLFLTAGALGGCI